MSAGSRDRYIIFQAAIESQAPSGERTLAWTGPAYFSCWAERKDLVGAERFQAQQLVAKGNTRYRIPYPTGKSVTPRDTLRIIDQGVSYDIVDVSELGRRGRAGLEILAWARAE